MDIDLIGFLPALLPVALSPGASFTLAINSALADGPRGLISALAGTALGIYTHALLIGLGITAALVASPAIFNILKITGTVYLLWLGIQLIRSGTAAHVGTFSHTAVPVTLKEAWLANVLNPKAILFYLTVVSQFAGRQADVNDYLVLASLHILVMVVWLLMIGRTLTFSARKLDPLMLKKWINIAGGLLLLAFSLKTLI
ncbi:threonine/homoserine/homoserine lactone efflux protein [Pantoea alhagi]|uniref:LysE family translocator n=1 Tax=Mixta sp. BE291 TaxID=3158787 RepID=UPI0028552073|nr:threonine/homoserine/homoserine lactone efflux protein [Pantoea alhagi]